MNLTICSPQLGLDPNSTLGGEVYDHQILTGLSSLRVNVQILLPKNKPFDQTNKNWQVKFLPSTRIPALLFNLFQLPYLFKTYRINPFQIIRLHAPYFTGIGAWFFRLFHPQVKLVAIYHQARTGFPYDLINQLFISSWDLIITDSQAAKKSLISRFNLDSNKIVPIYNGAPTYLKPKPSRKGTTLLYMGLLTPRKNPLFLIDLVKKLIPDHPNLRLIICGSGPLQPALTKRINSEKLQNHIKLHKPVFGADKQQLYDQADIFVHPSLHEGFPLVILEAMAVGLPIVISAGYSASEAVVDGQTGYLAKTNDLNDWTNKLDQLLSSDKLRSQMSHAALKRVKTHFTWKLAAQKHLKALLLVAQS